MEKKEKSAAIITVRDATNMTPRGRRQIAKWMRQQADFLENEGKMFAKRFTARYLYRDAQ